MKQLWDEVAYLGPVLKVILLLFFMATSPFVIIAALIRWLVFYPIWYITSGDLMEWILCKYCDFIDWVFQDFKG